MADRPLAPRSAFAGLLSPRPGAAGSVAGIVVRDRPGLRMATVVGRACGRAELAERARTHWGLALPAGPTRAAAGPVSALGTGPRSWLFLEDGGPPDFARRLSAGLGETAAVSDQSDGYAVLSIAGGGARGVLAKGLAIDLHPRAFDTTCVAVSSCSHIGVTVWQTDDAPTFEIALFRSFARSFAEWLAESAAEFGCELRSSD